MRSRKRAPVCLLLLLMPALAFTQKGYEEIRNPSLLIEKIRQASDALQTIECSFLQEKSLSLLSEKIISKGKF
ncbi:MAG TPA: hypothetical protein VMC08_10770, partial [Bacteroidales bacterium]|nr:hypothetical protein [Bacteroidales bacterium]